VVWHIREILPPGLRRRWFASRLRSDATKIVTVSEAVARWLHEEGLGECVEVVYNGVKPPPKLPNRTTAREEFGLKGEGKVVGLFGQLVEHKGALDFVSGAHRAVAADPTLQFLIAGYGRAAFMERVRSEIASGPAAERIRLVPPQDEIWPLLAAVDVVALTTRWPDPLPRVVMEAMGVGLPVVAYGGGGVDEMVVDGETGLLCEVGDVAGLVEAWLRLCRDAALRCRFGDAGSRRARDRFSLARHVDCMEAVLRTVI
jgi:glycosyltransferase involved in cell wall biosynthesis